MMKKLYGLTDAWKYWGETLTDHHKKKLKMEQTHGFVSLFLKHLSNRIVRMSCTEVDNIIIIRSSEFHKDSNTVTGEPFDSK